MRARVRDCDGGAVVIGRCRVLASYFGVGAVVSELHADTVLYLVDGDASWVWLVVCPWAVSVVRTTMGG